MALPTLPAETKALRVRVGAVGSAGGGVVTPDALGHAAVLAGDGRHLERVARAFSGRRVRTDSNAVAAVLRAADTTMGGGRIEVVMDTARGAGPRFLTCWEGAVGADGQLACCGAREGFELANPTMADAMGNEVVRRMGGRPHACGDGYCAGWLRDHGGNVEGPDADISS